MGPFQTSPWMPGIALGSILANQNISYTGTAGVIANAVGGSTGDWRIVRILCTTQAFVAIGASPTATTSDMPIGAWAAEYFVIPGGWKVSAIQSSAAGTLYVTETN